jgi:iron(II)-dependent oxidoreductase
VWEWTQSLWGENWKTPDFKYPYRVDDGRENLGAGVNVLRVLRGGAFYSDERDARCAYRYRFGPYLRIPYFGFRVVVAPGFASGL